MQPGHHSLQAKQRPDGAPSVVYGLRPSRRQRALTQRRELAHAAIWLLGIAGFLGPMVLARTSAHADLLRAVALVWFIVFGVINGLFVLRALPRRRFGRGRTLDRRD
jgi:hypothetical protein